MSKKWQELEFLDYKERQIRRRAQRKKELLESGVRPGTEPAAVAAAESKLQLRILIAGTTLMLGLLLYVLNLRSAGGPVGEGLAVVRVSGDVKFATPLKEWSPAPGERLQKGVRLLTGPEGKLELTTHASDTRLLLLPGSEAVFKDLRVGRTGKDFQVDVEVLRGSAVFEFKNPEGIGIVHVRTPQEVDLWGKLVYFKVNAADEKSTVVVADGFVKSECKGAKEIISADRQMVSTLGEPLSPPKALNILREVWTF